MDEKIENNEKLINNLEKANKLFFSKNYINNSNNESWKLVRLEECVDISRGASPRPIQEYLANDGMPWVKISDATETDSNFISKTHEFIIKSGISKSRTVTKGMLIVSNSATPALTRIMNITACVHDGWLILDNFSLLSKEIVKYIIDFNKKELISSGNGSVFTNLKTEILKSLQVKIPPQPIMDKITDRLKFNLNMQLQLTEENKKLNKLKQLYLKKFFG